MWICARCVDRQYQYSNISGKRDCAWEPFGVQYLEENVVIRTQSSVKDAYRC